MSTFDFPNANIALTQPVFRRSSWQIEGRLFYAEGEWANGEDRFEPQDYTFHYDQEEAGQKAQFLQDYTQLHLLAHYYQHFQEQGGWSGSSNNLLIVSGQHQPVAHFFQPIIQKMRSEFGLDDTMTFSSQAPEISYIDAQGVMWHTKFNFSPEIEATLNDLDTLASNYQKKQSYWKAPTEDIQAAFLIGYEKIQLLGQLGIDKQVKLDSDEARKFKI